MKYLIHIYFILFLNLISTKGFSNTDGTGLVKVDCRDFIASLPLDFMTGYISVPEDWNQPKGQKINVFYYGRKILDPSQPTIAFFNGGPSSSSHGSYEAIRQREENQKINFIYIDQRGTGCSTPYPEGVSNESAKRLENYTTRSIVNDAEEIRKILLGLNSKWKIFGQSYGGMIVQRYISMYPESIVAAYAHGYAIMTDQIEWMKLRILSQKRVIENYFQDYPQDRADLEKIKSLIPKDQCLTDNGISLCGTVFVDILRHPLGFHDSWADMHWWIENLAKFMIEQPSMIQGFSNFYYTDFTHDQLPSLVINKIEITKGLSDRDECNQAFKRLTTAGDNPEKWPINECRVLINLENHQFDKVLGSVQVTDALTVDSVSAALIKNSDLKFYLYAGEQDVFVPIETFQELAQKLNGLINFNFEIFKDSGHEGFFSEQKIWDDLRR